MGGRQKKKDSASPSVIKKEISVREPKSELWRKLKSKDEEEKKLRADLMTAFRGEDNEKAIRILNMERSAEALEKSWGDVSKNAITKGCIEVVETLLAKKVLEVNDVLDRHNRTPLMYAIICERPDIVELLLENGAKETINWRDKSGKTALDIASSNSLIPNDRVMNMLIENGARTGVEGPKSILDMLSDEELDDIIKKIMESDVETPSTEEAMAVLSTKEGVALAYKKNKERELKLGEEIEAMKVRFAEKMEDESNKIIKRTDENSNRIIKEIKKKPPIGDRILKFMLRAIASSIIGLGVSSGVSEIKEPPVKEKIVIPEDAHTEPDVADITEIIEETVEN